MEWAALAGALAGLMLGFLGAGGTVIGLPVILYLARLHPHDAMGTNAAGVALIALALLAWRALHADVPWGEALLFAGPGIAGDIVGGRLGLAFPGGRLVFLLGVLLFAVAARLGYLSLFARQGRTDSRETGITPKRAVALALTAVVVGLVSGFFAIGGGFMIVPALVLIGGLDLLDAAAAGLLPIAAFAAAVGVQYQLAGHVSLPDAGVMVPAGLLAGALGIAFARRVPKRLLQGTFALILVVIGIYMSLGS